MRVLVVCDDEARRAERLSALGRIGMEPVGGSSVVRVGVEVRGANPDVLLIDGVTTAHEARTALERARNAAERALGALLLLPADATWLRIPLPLDVRPAVVLASDGVDDVTLRRALERLRPAARIPTGTVAAHGVTLDLRSREVRANDSRAVLTTEEAVLLRSLLSEPSRVVRFEVLAQALTGRALGDPRTKATVAVHMDSLKGRLEPLRVADQLQAMRDLGYRFVERKGRPRPPR